MFSDLQEYKKTLQTFDETTKSTGLYWNHMEIAFRVFRFMGYMPYKVCNENGEIESSPQAWLWVGFASLLQVIIVIISDYILYDDKYWDTYDKTLESLIRLLNTNNTIFIFVTWWESHKIFKYVNGWDVFISNLEKVTLTSVSCLSRHKFRRILIYIATITLIAILLDQFMLQGGFHPFLLFSYFINIYVSALFTMFWAVNCTFIVQVARCMKDSFITVLQTKCDPSLIDKYRLLWIQLQHNAVNLAESFKGSVGLVVFVNLLSLIFSIYTWMTAAIYTKNTIRMIALTLPIVWNTVTLLVICEFSEMVSREVGQKLVSKILSFNFSSQNYAMLTSDEMNILFDTFDANSPDFTLHGFFTLNRSLLISMFSSIITYIIVLLQFQLSGEK